jgi:hypothetical protein
MKGLELFGWNRKLMFNFHCKIITIFQFKWGCKGISFLNYTSVYSKFSSKLDVFTCARMSSSLFGWLGCQLWLFMSTNNPCKLPKLSTIQGQPSFSHQNIDTTKCPLSTSQFHKWNSYVNEKYKTQFI